MQMKIVLAAVGFYERDIEYNRNKIIKCLKENSGKVDLILFGETFLQGFETLDWKYETDQHMALSVSDSNIQTIQKAAYHRCRWKYFESVSQGVKRLEGIFYG